jgi:uncharacterized damage-inducible protein DinB
MQPFADSFLAILLKLHAEITEAIDGLPDAALDWTPGPDFNSIAVLVTHVVGAARYWLGDVVTGEPSGRDRPAEFRAAGLDMATLTDRLTASAEYAREVFERLSLEDLDAIRIVPRDGSERTVAWCVAHVLEHAAVHTGHIQLTRQWWNQRNDG